MDNDINDLKGDVRVLKSVVENGHKETGRRLDNIERKIDAQVNVPVAAFDEYKKEAKDMYATRESVNRVGGRVKLLETIVFSAVGLIAVTVLGAVVAGVLK